MDKYPAVVEQLVSAAINQGMVKETEVTAVADGGNGLRENLERGFPKLKFIHAHRRCAYVDKCFSSLTCDQWLITKERETVNFCKLLLK